MWSYAETVTDIVGRTVEVPKNVEHVILGEGRFIFALGLLEGNKPLERVAAWQGNWKEADPVGYAELLKTHPEVDSIPLIGKNTEASVSSESALATQADVAIFGLGGEGPGPQNSLVAKLESAGVPVVFIDFRSNPLKNTVESMRILGKVLHREQQAQNYINLYEQHLNLVKKRIELIPEAQRPSVFVEILAGTREGCCRSVGTGSVGEFIEAAGGRNVAKEAVPGTFGDMNPEALIAADPRFYIATSSKAQPDRATMPAGPGVTLDEMSRGLTRLSQRPTVSPLTAWKQHRAYGIWHSFYDAPTHIVAVEVMAKWFHPDLFQDLNPEHTIDEINRKFLTGLPMKGLYFGQANGAPE